MDSVSAGPLRNFICSFPGCMASYNKAWKLDAHMCKHTGVRPFQCTRDGCDKSFCTKYHLARHELTHTGERPYRCTVDGCTEGFTTNSNLQKHIGRFHHHDQMFVYVCDAEGCGKVFNKNKQLKSHQREQHTLLPLYQCTFEGCQKTFSFPNKLRRHEKVHQGYPCKNEDCSFIGKTWTEYCKHRREAHRALFECSECDKVFRDSWFLQQHQRVHCEERQVLRCPREGCARSFTTLFNLHSHIRSFHEEQRPFACPHPGCGKTFAMKQSLQRHSVAHDPNRQKQKIIRPKRSLASRLSGYKEPSKRSCLLQQQEAPSEPYMTAWLHMDGSEHRPAVKPEPLELACLLQDTSLHNPVKTEMTETLCSDAQFL